MPNNTPGKKMVFSGLLSTSPGDRTPRAGPSRPKSLVAKASGSSLSSIGSHNDAAGTDYISDESHLRPLDPEAPDLRELNNSLGALAAVFPDIQIDVFREMLSSFDGESRLALVADALLKSRVSWVKGRWRVADKDKVQDTPGPRPNPDLQQDQPAPLVPSNETFRSEEYKRAVRTLAWQEFKGLSRSTINAVLAESNYSYLDGRRTLVDLSSKSWRFTISSLFLRRRPVTSSEAENHPLVIWRSTGHGSITPCVKATGNAELDKELYTALIVPLKQRTITSQVEQDRELAKTINEEEAEQLEAIHDCACCFTSTTFEEFTSCNAEGHMVCFRCVQHSVTEAVFGQGWRRFIDASTGTLLCPAVDSTECAGRIPSDHIQRALLEDKRGAEILHKLDERLAEHSLVAADLPLIRCPFCSYAEIDDIYLPATSSQLKLRANNIYNLVFVILLLGAIPFFLPIMLLSSLVALLLSSQHTIGDSLTTHFHAAVTRHRRRRRGDKFRCQSPRCGRTSCLSCSKEWADIHVCHESSLVALRTQVETAMSMAIKRVCPRCNTSFVKNAGCNKLTCPCGYKMCYVCRKDIGGTGDGPDVGYRHFCDHFRPEGDPKPCTQCNKCNLWESENTDAVLAQAKEEAERKWTATESRGLTGAEKTFLETGVALGGSSGSVTVEGWWRRGRWPSVEEVFDVVVENLFV
ncbi:hypothetical protein GE09DRAFT_1087620 [Coniochaeta sp. 2T2.1]|nr:hypothetical protein GE09DRAFT_1087620 [Coniochaeta sp. 2T2.1]